MNTIVLMSHLASLQSTLLGLPCPVNSVGSLPLDYIQFNEVSSSISCLNYQQYDNFWFVWCFLYRLCNFISLTESFQADEVEAVLANTKQILNQFLRKSRILLANVSSFRITMSKFLLLLALSFNCLS